MKTQHVTRHTSHVTPAAPPPLTPTAFLREIGTYLKSWLPELRQKRDFASVLEVETLQQIHGDASTHQERAAQLAFTARVEDDEAERCLKTVLADRKITPDEIPVLREALRHVKHSAAADHRLTEALTS